MSDTATAIKPGVVVPTAEEAGTGRKQPCGHVDGLDGMGARRQSANEPAHRLRRDWR